MSEACNFDATVALGNKCNFKIRGLPYKLKEHIQAEHDGVTFSCNKCNHKEKYKANLRYHQRNEHGLGTKLEIKCDLCNYTTLRIEALLNHKRKQHFDIEKKPLEIMHSCYQCEFKSPWKDYLKKHIELKHKL